MNPADAYRFCARCGAPLKKSGIFLLVCSSCRHHLYVNPLPTNAVIITNDKREILLVKRKFAPKKDYWDLPGGFLHPHETVEESVRREVREELGADIAVRDIVGIYPDTYVYQGVKQATLNIVVACALLSDRALIASDDISGYRYFSRETVLRQNLGFKSMRQAIKTYMEKCTTPLYNV